MDFGCVFAKGHAEYFYTVRLCASTQRLAEKNYITAWARVVRSIRDPKALDDPFGVIVHKTLVNVLFAL